MKNKDMLLELCQCAPPVFLWNTPFGLLIYSDSHTPELR